MTDQVFARAAMLTGDLDGQQQEVLHMLCGACAGSLSARLKEGLVPEDCLEEFLTAASFLAVDALEQTREMPREFRAGDLTVKTGTGEQGGLARQAERLMKPYLQDAFSFAGV